MRRRPLLALTVLVLGAATSCREERTPASSPRPVRVEAAELNAGDPRVRYSANIEPRERINLAFKVGGYVREVRQAKGADGRTRNLQEGDRVAAGTVLARVREDDYTENVNRARGSLGQAEASYQKAVLDFDRAKRLFAADSLTKPDFDSAQASHDASKSQLDAARASLASAEIQLRDTALVAPASGVILSRSIEVGSLVASGTVGFTMADTTSVKAIFGVPDLLVQRARLGLTFPVTTEAYGSRQFPGRITAIAPAADASSRVFQVELTIANAQNLLKPGMIATVAVPNEGESAVPPAPVLAVPLSAVVRPETSEGYSVFVVVEQDGKQIARRKQVSVGEVYGNRIAITQGLGRGERVIVTGAPLLTDGEAVRVIP